MSVKITKRLADQVKANRGRLYVFDTELTGFGLMVTPGGVKSFFVQYRTAGGRTGQKRRVALGRYGTLTVDGARTLARKTLAAVAHGADPAMDRNARKEAPTVATFGNEYLADVRTRRKETTAGEYVRLWQKHVEPAMGRKLVADVATTHVAALHRALRETPYVANRVLAVVGAFFTYAERQGVRAVRTNPARSVEPFPEKARERFLTPEETVRLGSALKRAEQRGLPPWRDRRRATSETAKHRPKRAGEPIRANPFGVAAIRFLILTGWRESEALSLRWTDVDLSRGLAFLADTKTGRSSRVMLAPVRLLLAELPRLRGSPYVFPGRSPDLPLVNVNALWYAVRHAAKLDDVRLHDLRHNFASVAAAGGVALLVIGKLLGHKNTATTAKYAHLGDDPVRVAGDATAGQLAALLIKGESPATEAGNDVLPIGRVPDAGSPLRARQ